MPDADHRVLLVDDEAQTDSSSQRTRREFIARLGTAAAWPAAARGQQLVTIGWLHQSSRVGYAPFLAAFHQGLSEYGYVEGRNLAVEYRFAEDHFDRLPAMAAELVQRRVAVIAAAATPAALAAKAATATIPIVYSGADDDPVKNGLAASFNRPGGNVTGMVAVGTSIAGGPPHRSVRAAFPHTAPTSGPSG
jgi:putative tryptophan/tyrosine transport system substrate-binding protein